MSNRPAKTPAARRRSRLARLVAFVAVPSALLAWSSEASAQGWLADRRYATGEGIRSGDFVLHPGVGFEAGYDSNFFMRSSKTGASLANGAPSLPPVDSFVLRLTPSFLFSTAPIGEQGGGGSPGTARTMVLQGGISAAGRYLSGSDPAFEKQRNVALNSDVRLDVNPDHPLGFNVTAGYTRLLQPQVLGVPDQSFDRNDLRGGAEVVVLPGGGALDLRAGYGIVATLFEDAIASPYTSVAQTVSIKDRWRFRPRTAVFQETSLGFISYPNAARAFNYLNGATPLRTRVGLTGLVTNRLSLLLAGGYSATFFANPSAASSAQYDSVNVQTDATYYLGPGNVPDEPGKATVLLSSITVGYRRDFQTSLLSNFYTSDRGHLRVEYMIGSSAVVRIDGYAEKLSYPPVYVQSTQPRGALTQVTNDFSNLRFGGVLFAEYRIKQRLGLNASIDYTRQISDTLIPAGVPSSSGVQQFFDMNYGRLQAFGGVRYFY